MPQLNEKDSALFGKLSSVAIDTIWSALNGMGYDTFIEGLKPVHRDLERKMVGRAVTLRYLPMRKDLAERVHAENKYSLNARAAEQATPGTVMVVDSGGEIGAGFLGDVIATRFQVAGGVGLVVDGAIRDQAQIRHIDLAVYVRGTHPGASGRRIVGVDYNIPVRCGGVAVLPGDILVGDAEGVIVIPAHLAEEVADKAVAMEDKENYLREKLLKGASIYGVYPPSQEVLQEYEEWRKKQKASP
jgi:regulator of RNase E activity RraA